MASNYQGRTDLPRGLRNNNPGNIAMGDSWMGMVGNDGTFVIFSDMSWGIRAMYKAIVNMINGGADTITKLIGQWSTTDQSTYIASVSSATGLDPNEQLGTDPDTITSLVRAMINVEIGQPSAALVTDADMAAGVALANGGVATVAQAAVVQAQANPLETALIAAGFLTLLYFFFEE